MVKYLIVLSPLSIDFFKQRFYFYFLMFHISICWTSVRNITMSLLNSYFVVINGNYSIEWMGLCSLDKLSSVIENLSILLTDILFFLLFE